MVNPDAPALTEWGNMRRQDRPVSAKTGASQDQAALTGRQVKPWVLKMETHSD